MIQFRQILSSSWKPAVIAAAFLCMTRVSPAGLRCCDPPRAYCIPSCHPTWGYHQTCWRRFPPLQPCPGQGDFCPTCENTAVPQVGTQQGAAVGTMMLPPMNGNAVVHPAPGQGFVVPGKGAVFLPQGQVPGPAAVIPAPAVVVPAPAAGQPVHQIPTPTPGIAPVPDNTPLPPNPAPLQPNRTNPPPNGPAPLPVNPAPLVPRPMNEQSLPQPAVGVPAQTYAVPQHTYTYPASFSGTPTTAYPVQTQQPAYGGQPIYVAPQQQNLQQQIPMTPAVQQQQPAAGAQPTTSSWSDRLSSSTTFLKNAISAPFKRVSFRQTAPTQLQPTATMVTPVHQSYRP